MVLLFVSAFIRLGWLGDSPQLLLVSDGSGLGLYLFYFQSHKWAPVWAAAALGTYVSKPGLGFESWLGFFAFDTFCEIGT